MENNIGKNEALNFIITLLKKLKNKEELSGDFEESWCGGDRSQGQAL